MNVHQVLSGRAVPGRVVPAQPRPVVAELPAGLGEFRAAADRVRCCWLLCSFSFVLFVVVVMERTKMVAERAFAICSRQRDT